MSRKRRLFQIDAPDDALASGEDAPLETKSISGRRAPMAAAVHETAQAARSRRSVEEQVRAENDRLAHEHVRLKKLGLVIELIPLAAINTDRLIRDRDISGDLDLDDLKTSIREVGLSNPIRVEQTGEGRYELVQGFRRLSAYRELHAEAGEEIYARIPAGKPGAEEEGAADPEALALAYRRMVDENAVRKDVSFAEMAELATAYAADPGVDCDDVDRAVATLFRSSGYQKRSYIRAFAHLLEVIGKDLAHASAIPRNLGLEVRRELSRPGRPAALTAALRAHSGRSAERELSILRGFVGGFSDENGEGAPPPAPITPHRAPRQAKTTFRVAAPDGEAKCAASSGKLEIRGDTDFSAYDRRRLETAVAALFRALDE